MPLPPALAQRFPALEGHLPWRPLGCWPTPVQRLSRLGTDLGTDLWIKRDDLSAPRYGGNKVRKLELLLGAALDADCASLVTVGGIGSSHLIAVAVHGAALGLPVHGVTFPQPLTPHVHHNVELLQALDVDLVPCPARALVPFAMLRARSRASRPYVIGPGGSSALGALGYVAAALELQHQIQDGALPEPDAIYVALGSGGTMAGLVLGCRIAGLRPRIVGVRVVERVLMNELVVGWLQRRTESLLRERGAALDDLPPERSIIVHDQLGGRYGQPTAAARDAVQQAAQTEGLQLETTYTGKTLAALIADCRAGAARGQRLLFWNTANSRDTAPLLAVPTRRPLPAAVQRWLALAQGTCRCVGLCYHSHHLQQDNATAIPSPE